MHSAYFMRVVRDYWLAADGTLESVTAFSEPKKVLAYGRVRFPWGVETVAYSSANGWLRIAPSDAVRRSA